MKPVTLNGHFDGEKGCLARRDSQASFARANAEEEPDYSDAVLRKQRPKE